MNRHTRRANKTSGPTEGQKVAPAASQMPLSTSRPGLLLRLFSGVLLARWVIKRVNHPDVLAILRQLAQQTGRTDAADFLSSKLRNYTS